MVELLALGADRLDAVGRNGVELGEKTREVLFVLLQRAVRGRIVCEERRLWSRSCGVKDKSAMYDGMSQLLWQRYRGQGR